MHAKCSFVATRTTRAVSEEALPPHIVRSASCSELRSYKTEPSGQLRHSISHRTQTQDQATMRACVYNLPRNPRHPHRPFRNVRRTAAQLAQHFRLRLASRRSRTASMSTLSTHHSIPHCVTITKRYEGASLTLQSSARHARKGLGSLRVR